MARETIWIEKTKFKSMLDSIEVEIQEIEQTAKILRNLVKKFNRAIIYEEKSQ